jgi:hypothetical protein
MASSTMVVGRWAKAVLQWLYRWFQAPRRDLILYRNNDTLKGIVTFRLGLRHLRFEFESPWLHVGDDENKDEGYARVTSFYLVDRDRHGAPHVTDARFVGLDRMFWVQATDPYDREGSLEEAFAQLVAALRAKSPAALLEERMAPDSKLQVAPAERRMAEKLLARAHRDRGYSAIGDGELTWRDPEASKEVASGYYGAAGDDVHVYFPDTTRSVRFAGKEATRLHNLGVLVGEGPL